MLIKKYQKEIRRQEEATALRKRLKQNMLLNEKSKNKIGIVEKSKKIGKKQYKMKSEAF